MGNSGHIAIVGVGCRFPSAPDVESFWELLCSGRDVLQAGYDDRRLDLGSGAGNDDDWVRRLRSLRGGFLDDIDAFDAAAFDISAREARLLDPQQRLMLETSWAALDDAGQDIRRLAGRKVGVYVGVYGTDYQSRLFRHFPDVDVSLTTGASSYALSGRISYAFGFEGPSFTLHTACSSSLVAIHEACQSLRSGESEIALAGGVNLLLDPVITLAYLNAGALSLDSRCRFGDSTASGYVRSEGVAMLVLKPLDRARADGDPIHAVIRSSLVSHVGQTGSSLLQPSEESQVSMFNDALERAGLRPSDLDYIEAHGTGTRVGDRIELTALGAMLAGDADRRETPCLIGSVKTSIGHTESAAGVAGVITAMLCLKHGEVPPNRLFQTPNPDVQWDDRLFRIPTSLTAIGNGRRPATATVSSYGITGTMACVVLEAVPPAPATVVVDAPRDAAETPAAPFIVPLSARSSTSLHDYADKVRTRLRTGTVSISDLAYNTALRRTHHDMRVAIVGRTADELAEALDSYLDGEPGTNIRTSPRAVVSAPKVGWVFCGQGPQWAGMGMGLYDTYSVFRASIDDLDALIRSEAGFSVIDEIKADESASRLDLTEITQPALFSIQVALADLLRSWGLIPAMIVGHSVGEVAAAHVAGVMTREDAVRVICARGRIAEKATGLGRMAAFEASLDEAKHIVAQSAGEISIAVVNGPRSVTLSGRRAPLEAACARAEAAGRFARLIDVDYPSHCALLDPLLPEMAAASATVAMNPPKLPLFSTVLGREAEPGERAQDYWARNLREPVLFAPAIEAMAAAGCDLFVEISPHPALSFSINQVLDACGAEASVIATLRRGDNEADLLAQTVSAHYVVGADPDWTAVAPTSGTAVALPAYAWDHERYWIEERPSGAGMPHDTIGVSASLHALLQRRLDILGPNETVYFQSELSLARFPWLGDHRVRGRATFPAAGYLVAALAAGSALSPGSSLADVAFLEALPVPDTGTICVQFGLVADDGVSGGYRLSVDAKQPDRSSRQHCTARLLPSQQPFRPARTLRPGGNLATSKVAFYAAMTRAELHYGALFQGVEAFTAERFEATAKLGPIPQDTTLTGLHPATVDACLQTLLALVPGWGHAADLWLPQSVKRVRYNADGALGDDMIVQAVGIPSLLGQDFMGDILLFNSAGTVVLSLEGVQFHRLSTAGPDMSIFHEVRWMARPLTHDRIGDDWLDPAGVIAAAAAISPPQDEQIEIARVRQQSDQLAGLAVQNALRTCGFDFTPGRRFGFAELTGDIGIVPAHHRLLRRMLAILCEDNVLAVEDDGWRIQAQPPVVDLSSRLDATMSGAPPGLAAFWRIFARSSLHLAEVLAGRMDATELLFGRENAALLEDLYARHLFWRTPIRRLETAVASLVKQLPAGQTVRVLEVGAGTGGLTSHLLPLLPLDRTHYAFTDITRFFFEPARARFARYAFLSPRQLDIEQDPGGQGFEPASFDVVIAANCLHATADVRQAVEHCANLLKPGGLLLLQEETVAERWTDLIFGITQGWWRFQDADLRPDHALLSSDQWSGLLTEAGFDATAIFGGQESDPSGAVAIVARKPPRTTDGNATPWLLLGGEGDVASRLAQRLDALGQPCRVVAASAAELGMEDYFNHGDQPGQVLIDLRPLDACIADDAAIDTLIQTESVALDRVLQLLQRRLDSNRRNPPKLVLVTAGSQALRDDAGPVAMAQATVWTIVRNAALENPGMAIAAIDIPTAADAAAIDALAVELMAPDGDPEVALRHGQRSVRRLMRADQADPNLRPLPQAPFSLVISQRGALDGFDVVPAVPAAPGVGEVQIRVHAAGVNFRDLLNLLGAVDEVPLGLECAGVVTAVGAGVEDFAIGASVIAAGLGSWRSHFNTSAALVAAMPGMLSYDQAAALPIAYLTAHYALRHLARLKPGQSVLIHSAAGGVGLAALHIARAMGADVVGTAGSALKRDAVAAFGARYVFDSRSLSFADEMRARAIEVDVVINSFTGDFIPAGLDRLARGGTFIEIGKRDIWTAEQVAERRPDVTYHIVELAEVMREAPQDLAAMLRCIAGEVESGLLPALPIRCFPMSETLSALRFVQQARQTGKVVLAAPPATDQPITSGATLITGGLGGLGLAVARWLADQGHRQIILAGRRAPGADAAIVIDALRASGTDVRIEPCDMGEHDQVVRLIARCGRDLPPLKRIFHLAGLLDDAPVHQLDTDHFLSVYRPKVFGAWSLHQLTRSMPIEQFVLFSSWTAVLGSPAQANHASANAFLDALAHHRRANGLVAQSINWGGWSETGAAADPVRLAHLARQGLTAMSNATALDALGHVLASDAIQVAISPFDPAAWRVFAGASAGATVLAALDPATPNDTATAVIEPPAVMAEPSLADAIAGLPAGPARRTLLETQIKKRLSQVLRTPAKAFDVRKPFKSLGLDSLTALELRNALEADTALKLSASLIFNHASISKLATELAMQMDVSLDADQTPVSEQPTIAEPDDVAALLDALQAMPEDEALQLLLNEEAPQNR